MLVRSGIFLLHEGLPKTIFDSQVVSHVKDMQRYGIEMEVWSYALSDSHYKNSVGKLSELRRDGSNVRLFRGVWKFLPFSEIINSALFAFHLNKYSTHPEFIHCRTEYSASVAGFLKLIRQFRLVWDVRGDSESEFLYKKAEGFIVKSVRWAYLPFIRFRLFWAAQKADVAIFVSEALENLIRKRWHTYKSVIIPCLADQNRFFFDPIVRRQTRERLGIQDTDVTLIYSGSMAPWQCFPETVSLIKNCLDRHSGWRAIILTPESVDFSPVLRVLPKERAHIVHASFDEVNQYLNAADFAFFLRKPNPINFVASPVKFAEYCLTGLPIVMTGAVEQSSRLAQENGNYIAYDFENKLAFPKPFSSLERSQVVDKYKKILSRQHNSNKYLDVYGLQVSCLVS